MKFRETVDGITHEYEGTPQEIAIMRSAIRGKACEIPPMTVEIKPSIDMESFAQRLDNEMRRRALRATGNPLGCFKG